MVIMHWCVHNLTMERRVESWRRWSEENHPDWRATRHQVQNADCGGPIRCRTYLLVLSPATVSAKIGPFDEVDLGDTMEGYLDDPNMRYSDYLSGWTMVQSKPKVPEDSRQPVTELVVDQDEEH